MAARLRRAALAAGACATFACAQDPGFTVTVSVEGVRSDVGNVVANLCSDPRAFPCPTYRVSAPAVPGEMRVVFTGVPVGRYGVAVFHDENADGFPQIPKEGVGLGNGARLNAAFDVAAIDVHADATASVTIYYDGPQVGSKGVAPPDGVIRIDVREHGLYGEFYRPDTDVRVPALVLIGGSEGGLDSISSLAPSFAKAGYGVLALAYWAAPGLPTTLANIPLEYFDTAVAWLKSRPDVQDDAIGAFGWSRGSEAALLLGARNVDVHAVAVSAPSGVVWQGFDSATPPNPVPSWTADGVALAYLTVDYSRYAQNAPTAPMFVSALPQAGTRPEVEIPVERIDGPLLLICGQDDALWPSPVFAERIVARLNREGFAHKAETLVYPGAGHAVFAGAPDSDMARGLGATPPAAILGGSAAGDRAAWADNWPKTVAFFDAALKYKPR